MWCMLWNMCMKCVYGVEYSIKNEKAWGVCRLRVWHFAVAQQNCAWSFRSNAHLRLSQNVDVRSNNNSSTKIYVYTHIKHAPSFLSAQARASEHYSVISLHLSAQV